MIFQEPMTEPQPGADGRPADRRDAAPAPGAWPRRGAETRPVEMLLLVGIPAPERRRAASIRTSLSGGMRQRVMIAMALACNPKLLIADEPTTALDVTIQAQILDLMRDLQARLGAAIMLITHDLGVVAEMAQRVVVMYAGRKVEEAAVEAIFGRPLHPYTRGLLGSVPRLGSSLAGGGRRSWPRSPARCRAATSRSSAARFAGALPVGDRTVPRDDAGGRGEAPRPSPPPAIHADRLAGVTALSAPLAASSSAPLLRCAG